MPRAVELLEHATRRFDRKRFAAKRKSILSLHMLGRSSRLQTPQIPYGQSAALAKKRGISVAQLGFARQFANPDRGGYSAQSLRDVLRRCERARFMVGLPHLAILITVPPLQRRAFLKRMLEHRLTVAEAKTELRRQFGHRRHGGRRPHGPESLRQFWAQLQSRLESFRRWRHVASELFEKTPALRSRANVMQALRLLEDVHARVATLLVVANQAASRNSRRR